MVGNMGRHRGYIFNVSGIAQHADKISLTCLFVAISVNSKIKKNDAVDFSQKKKKTSTMLLS